MNLYDIKSPTDIKKLSDAKLQDLAQQIRVFLVENISKTGGHLSSNLGVVELTLAMHYVFSSPTDKFIFDVGHQSYVHKMLTGRVSNFPSLRQYKGMSGFQKRKESKHDVWEAGHSSTSLSAAMGMAVARDLQKQPYHIVPVIGDGALTSGMAIEALNQIGSEQRNMVIIFNDNNMSISKNVGVMDEAFTKLRTSKSYNVLKDDLKGALSTTKVGTTILHRMKNMKNKVKENVVDTFIFGAFNLDYIGPVDGHDLPTLLKVFTIAKAHEGPIVVHVITKKGKGYPLAEEDRSGKWHGVSAFDPHTGQFVSHIPKGHISWSEVMSATLLDLAKTNTAIVAITPAMIGGSKLETFFKTFPSRSFDCGIAEGHAMTFAAGLCTSKLRPFISVYSSFLQRAYDQINHDVARMDLPVVIGIDRCGLVGEDGETHHGVFDIAMLRGIPNMIIAQPKDAYEAQDLLYSAFLQNEHAYAIRYPRGHVPYEKKERYDRIHTGTWTSWKQNDAYLASVITYGPDVDQVITKAQVDGIPIQVINARFLKPVDEHMLLRLCAENKTIIIYETDMLIGGLSSAIMECCNDHKYQGHVIRMGIQDHYVEHGSIAQLRKLERIDLDSLFDLIRSILG